MKLDSLKGSYVVEVAAWLLCSIFVALSPTRLCAQLSYESNTLPTSIVLQQSTIRGYIPKLSLTVFMRQSNPVGLGYAFFDVEFVTGAPVAQDTEIELDVGFSVSYGQLPSTRLQLTIPQGQTSALGKLVLPLTKQATSLTTSIRVDGQLDRSFALNIWGNFPSCLSASLWIGDRDDYLYFQRQYGTPLNQTLVEYSRYQDGSLYPGWCFYSGGPPVANVGQMSCFVSVERCPTVALEYNTAETVSVTIANLLRLKEEQLKALTDHIALGRMLHIFGESAEDFARFQEFCSTIGIDPSRLETRNLHNDNSNASVYVFGDNTFSDLRSHMFGLGQINYATVGYLSELSTLPLPRVTESFVQQEANFVSNNGVNYETFWDWSLAELGSPPVVGFSVLIVLLIGIIAPLLLTLCMWKGRPVWLLLMVPLLGVVSTVSLMVYGITKDGFSTTERVRSLTIMTGEKEGAVYARDVMFSGLAAKEISFAKNAEVWQLDYELDQRPSQNSTGELVWRDDRQIYRDVIKSREQFQFIRKFKLDDIQPFEWIQKPKQPTSAEANDGVSAIIKNLFDEPIAELVIADGKGMYYIGHDIGAGTQIELVATRDYQAVVQAVQRMEDAAPMMPPHNMLYSGPMQRSFRSYRPRAGIAGPYLIEQTSKLNDQANLSSVPCYLVYLRDGKFLESIHENANRIDSLHLIYGEWRNDQ